MRMIKSRRVRWTGYAIGRGGEKCSRFLWDNVKKKRPLGRPRPRCEDDMKTDLEGRKKRVCILESCYSGH
jgi:hypothetical protein